MTIDQLRTIVLDPENPFGCIEILDAVDELLDVVPLDVIDGIMEIKRRQAERLKLDSDGKTYRIRHRRESKREWLFREQEEAE